MKWIAVRSESGKSIEIVRVDCVSGFYAADTDVLWARFGLEDRLVSIDPPEPIKSFLAQLNGPVGEVPWK